MDVITPFVTKPQEVFEHLFIHFFLFFFFSPLLAVMVK